MITSTALPLERKTDLGAVALFSVVVFSALVVVPWFGITYGYTAVDWITFGILYTVTGLGITVGYHRLVTHRSFNCPAPVKIAFLIAGGWALENSALKWSADHLRHHARTDTDEDPYNALRGFWYSHCGWLLSKDPYYDEKYEAPFRKDRWVMWQYRSYAPIVLSGLALPFVIGFLFGGLRGGFGCLLLAGVARIFLVLNSTFCINSICHIWGDQPYGSANSSRNSFWISVITFGEGYHNYHHAYPRDYRNGALWYNFDPSKWLIFSLSKVGLSGKLVRMGSKNERATTLPDPLDTLQRTLPIPTNEPLTPETPWTGKTQRSPVQ
jgi:stearoyl-CoA desaturase (Delta-9 desaturase)